MGLCLICLLVVSLAASFEICCSSLTVCGVDEEGFGRDTISFSPPKYTPSGLGSERASESSVAVLVVSRSVSPEKDEGGGSVVEDGLRGLWLAGGVKGRLDIGVSDGFNVLDVTALSASVVA